MRPIRNVLLLNLIILLFSRFSFSNDFLVTVNGKEYPLNKLDQQKVKKNKWCSLFDKKIDVFRLDKLDLKERNEITQKAISYFNNCNKDFQQKNLMTHYFATLYATHQIVYTAWKITKESASLGAHQAFIYNSSWLNFYPSIAEFLLEYAADHSYLNRTIRSFQEDIYNLPFRTNVLKEHSKVYLFAKDKIFNDTRKVGKYISFLIVNSAIDGILKIKKTDMSELTYKMAENMTFANIAKYMKDLWPLAYKEGLKVIKENNLTHQKFYSLRWERKDFTQNPFLAPYMNEINSIEERINNR